MKNTTSRTDICNYMTCIVVKYLNLIDEMKMFAKTNCNTFTEDTLTILKIYIDKCVTIMNKNSDIYGACQHKMTHHQFF